MNGKICLVTGATNGIGRATAQALARMGATVIIVGRDAQKTSRVVEEIRAASGNPGVGSMLADLSSEQEVRLLADEFKSKYSHLHVLINNAGGFFMRRQVRGNGIEMTFALNHLAAFLFPEIGVKIHGLLAIAPTIAEVWTLGYLLVVGVKTGKTVEPAKALTTVGA